MYAGFGRHAAACHSSEASRRAFAVVLTRCASTTVPVSSITQSQFDPIPIGERIWVVPSWHAAPDPDALVLELDPGLAFGTGSHPTTRLCMEWLEQNVKQDQSVLDYGCGSGILAILAKKCGAKSKAKGSIRS